MEEYINSFGEPYYMRQPRHGCDSVTGPFWRQKDVSWSPDSSLEVRKCKITLTIRKEDTTEPFRIKF